MSYSLSSSPSLVFVGCFAGPQVSCYLLTPYEMLLLLSLLLLLLLRGRGFLVIYSFPAKMLLLLLVVVGCCWLLLVVVVCCCLLIPGRIRGETSHPASCKIIPGDFQKPYFKKKMVFGNFGPYKKHRFLAPTFDFKHLYHFIRRRLFS